MNTNYNYCSGVTCPIRQSCNRYLPDPPEERLKWINPSYNKKEHKCNYFEGRV